jgi:hypothetical protein
MEVSLLSLDPRWIEHDEHYIGIAFTCPFEKCPSVAGDKHTIGAYWAYPGKNNWKKTGETFENLTLEPSIDGSPMGCSFHGHIINGKVVY